MIHLLHIPKTGGTGAAYSFREAIKEHKLRKRSHPIRLSDIPKRDTAIIIVREPVARFISAYDLERRRLPTRPHIDKWPTIESFVDGFPESFDIADIYSIVFRPMVTWFNEDRDVRIARTENLYVDLRRIAGDLDIEYEPLPKGNEHRNESPKVSALDAARRRAVASFYDDDVRLYERQTGGAASRVSET